MTDISAVLLKSLKKRDPWDPVARQRVYTQARMAMLRKLWSLQPPLLPDEIEANVAKFDSAAARLEAEFEARSKAGEATERAPSPPPTEEPKGEDSSRPRVRESLRVPPRQQPPVHSPRVGAAPRVDGAEEKARPEEPVAGAKPAPRPAATPAVRSPLGQRPSDAILPPEQPPPAATPARPPVAPRPGPAGQARAYETRPIEVRPQAARPASARPPRETVASEDFYPQPSRPAPAAPRGPDRQGRPAAKEPARPQRPARAAPSAAERPTAAPSPVLGAARARRRNAAPEVVLLEEPAPVQVERLNAYLRQVGNERDVVRPDPQPRRRIGFGQVLFGLIAVAALGVSAWAFVSFYPRLSREAALVGDAQPVDLGPSALAAPAQTLAAAPPLVEGELTVVEEITLFDGRDPSVFESSAENPIRLEGDGTSGYAHVISTITSPRARADIGPGLAQNLVGKTVRVTVNARSPEIGGSAMMRFAYEAAGERSQWQTVILNPAFTDSGLIWRVPVVERDGHAIVIEPLDGDGTATDISEIRIEVLAP